MFILLLLYSWCVNFQCRQHHESTGSGHFGVVAFNTSNVVCIFMGCLACHLPIHSRFFFQCFDRYKLMMLADLCLDKPRAATPAISMLLKYCKKLRDRDLSSNGPSYLFDGKKRKKKSRRIFLKTVGRCTGHGLY